MSEQLNEKLGRLIETLDVANLLTQPLVGSIKKMLEITALRLNSADASVLIRDDDDGTLRFLAATGSVADQLQGMRIPAGKGIAGFVMSSGQPMCVSDVGTDESFYAEVDKTTGFSTQMILATPLRYDGEIIGVLEYINRLGTPPFQPFTPEEMDEAAEFADVFAYLLNAYESAKEIRDFTNKFVEKMKLDEADNVLDWLQDIRSSSRHKEMLELAVLVREISSRGDKERELCREILNSIARFSDAHSETSYLNF